MIDLNAYAAERSGRHPPEGGPGQASNFCDPVVIAAALREAAAEEVRPGEEPGQAAEVARLPPPPAVPIHVFPAPIQDSLTAAAEAFRVPLEVPTCAVLAMAAACIGRARGVIIKAGWVEHANLYLALVAKSGLGKSPCTRAFLGAIYRAEKGWNAEWSENQDRWQEEMDAWQDAKRKHRRGEGDDPGPKPDQPRRRQLVLDDATIESITDALTENPRGLLWCRDELAGLLMDMDKYAGKDGATKTRLMSAYDSGSWKVSRTNKARIGFIEHATLSIFGTVQPKTLAGIFCGHDAASGFLPRFLFIRAVQDKPATWTDATFDGRDRERIDSLAASLLALDFGDDGKPVIIGVDGAAKRLYRAWHDRLAMEAWMGPDDDSDSLLSKLRGQCLRLALILHEMHAAILERDDRAPVEEETMAGAIALSDWLREHQGHAWKLIGSAGQVVESAPLDVRVATAIVSLEGEIQGGRLPTAKVAEKVNAGLDPSLLVDVRAVGKACSRLGLTMVKTNGPRMIEVFPHVLTRMRVIGNATNATNATNP
ncbi:DUF3987 domain-containing protein [Desulfovibrio sp. TomC]|uniref:DUF3987 domain-containing protein n=1 Tax=Desulfovibrio sp. TomC TaxID=1562888 RepID=UPI0005BA3F96|nr:DUF3987 domain-containing protein [Desulfovibrio sp. TomC]